MMALRFANQLFEPVWNNNYVDHVQITMAEDIGIGGRAGYFDGIGIARDVIQNHLLQLLALTAMEEPTSFEARQLRARSRRCWLRPARPSGWTCTPRGGSMRAAGPGGEKVLGYLEEERIPKDSRTETYAAIRLDIDNRRWAGVPFYLRTGKRLARRVTEIALGFKRAPAPTVQVRPTPPSWVTTLWCCGSSRMRGVTLRFGAKVPGTQMEIREVNMDFAYGESFTESSPEAYERLILDVLLGDPPCSPSTRRSSCPGRSWIPSWTTGRACRTSRAVRAGSWGRRAPTRCSPATASPGGRTRSMIITLDATPPRPRSPRPCCGPGAAPAARRRAWC
jgi:glucose-6-phosphate 1-dehydrogenase